MLEADSRLAKEILELVLPNIVYPDELRKMVEREADRSESAETFMKNVKKAISGQADITRKTDWRIFLNEFQRRVSRNP
jgi:uncharacterized membrane protein YheB (UPF0754 family)